MMMMMLNSLRVKTQFYEDSRMSRACQMWHVGISLAPSYIILKNMYIPVGVVQGLHHYHFEDRNIDVSSSQNFLLSLIIIIVIVCAQVYPVYAPETLPSHHS